MDPEMRKIELKRALDISVFSDLRPPNVMKTYRGLDCELQGQVRYPSLVSPMIKWLLDFRAMSYR